MRIEFNFRKRLKDKAAWFVLPGWSWRHYLPEGDEIRFPELLIDLFGITLVFPVRPKIRTVYSGQGIQLQHFEESGKVFRTKYEKVIATQEKLAEVTDKAWKKIKEEHIAEVVPIIKKIYEEKK